MIKGEKVFTAKVRATFVKRAMSLSTKLLAQSKNMAKLAVELDRATRSEQLEAIDMAWVSRWLTYDEMCGLRPFYEDHRSTCYYCKRKEFGGISGLLYSHHDRFCCHRQKCYRAYRRDIAKDKLKYPRKYVEKSHRRVDRVRRAKRRKSPPVFNDRTD